MASLAQFKDEVHSAHFQQQAGRFLRLTVVAVGAQLAALGTTHLTRDALVGVLVGAVETAYRQWAQVVPWARVAAKLHLVTPGATEPGVPPATPPH